MFSKGSECISSVAVSVWLQSRHPPGISVFCNVCVCVYIYIYSLSNVYYSKTVINSLQESTLETVGSIYSYKRGPIKWRSFISQITFGGGSPATRQNMRFVSARGNVVYSCSVPSKNCAGYLILRLLQQWCLVALGTQVHHYNAVQEH